MNRIGGYDGFLFHMALKSVNVLTITLNSSDDGKIKQTLLYLSQALWISINDSKK